MRSICLFLFVCLIGIFSLQSQTTIWSEDFNAVADDGVGATGPIPVGTNTGVTAPSSGKWSLDVTSCELTASSDWFRVVSQMLEARDIDGDGSWTSESIDISGYTNVTISVDASESGTMESSDYAKASYQIDGGSITQFGYANDDFSSQTFSISGLSGSSLVVILEVNNGAGSEYHRFDDVTVSGLASGGVNNPSSFTATVNSTTQIDLSWVQNGNGNDVMVAWTSDNTFGTPTDGSSYSAGDPITGGGTVIYNGGLTSYNHTPLSSGTVYYYKAWSVDGSDNYSSGVTDNATTYKDEPSNHVTSFTTSGTTATTITLTWSDNDGSVVADGYLVKASTSNSFTDPVDGVAVSDDTDLSDGSGSVNVSHGTETYTWSGLDQSTQYYFSIWPYTNSSTSIDYKTDGTVPTTNGTTVTANLDLIISEVTDPNDTYQAKFVEIHNLSGSAIDFSSDTWYISRQANGSSWGDLQLTGTIDAGGTYTIAYSQSNFNTAYGFNPDQEDGIISGNGDDAYFLYYDGDHTTGTLVDIFGAINEDGSGKDWEYTNSKAVRKRSVTSPNTTWTLSEWVITESANVVNMTPGKAFGSIVWQGTTDSNWDTKSNWDLGFIPDVSMNVSVSSTSNDPEISSSSYAHCWSLTVNAGASLTVKSDAGGQGTLICEGTKSGNVSVECYTTSGQWHGISPAVSGQTANALYLGGSPNVWLKQYNESTNTYSSISELGTSLGTGNGWMIWIENGAANQTFTFTGSMNSGTVSPSSTIVRSQAGSDYGFNFIGNPFTSAIDWSASSGWTKTNIEDAIYVYNNGTWASYVSGTGTNGGSQYIAMNQGFFVQVKDDGSTSGTINMTSDIQVYNSIAFRKKQRDFDDSKFIRLNITDGELSDETVIKLSEDATIDYDSELDARKLFSLNSSHPQIFSTLNEKMSINTLPEGTGSVGVDVTGANGSNMTLSLTENVSADEVYLVDELTGEYINLLSESYNFKYESSFENRFTIHFSTVSVEEFSEKNDHYNVLTKKDRVEIFIPSDENVSVEIFDLMGRKVVSKGGCSGKQTFNLNGGNYYVVKISNSYILQSELVIIN